MISVFKLALMIQTGVSNYFFFYCRGDVAYFDGLIETILAVGLVKPKQGICA